MAHNKSIVLNLTLKIKSQFSVVHSALNGYAMIRYFAQHRYPTDFVKYRFFLYYGLVVVYSA
jgi:hypothetical protein